MLTKLITLYVIDEIFANDCIGKVTPIAKMLYINCLSHNFKDKLPSLPNLNDFIILKASIPNYNSYKTHFENLCNASLIVDENYAYKFISHWIKYVELNRLNQMNDFESRQAVNLDEYEKEFYQSQQLIELCCMKNNINKQQVINLMEQFLKEQKVTDKTYTNIGDAKKHFIYWCAINKDKLPKETIVKSKSKILGL
jgi:hypothetical protein